MRIVSWTTSPDCRSGMLDPDSILKFKKLSNVLQSSKACCNLKHALKTQERVFGRGWSLVKDLNVVQRSETVRGCMVHLPQPTVTTATGIRLPR